MVTVIEVPGIPLGPLGSCHALKAGHLTWTSAICGTNPGTAHYPRHAIGEMEQALEHLRAVLDAAGHDWRDLVRVNVYYAAGRIDQKALAACQQTLTATIGAGSCAGTGILLAPAAEGARLAIEAVAADRRIKQLLPGVAGIHSGAWATATRVDSTVFISAVLPNQALLDGESPSGLPQTAGGTPFFARSHSAYRNLAFAAEAVSDAWPDCKGLGDVVRVHQHITRPDIDLADFRRSRADLLRTGDFVSTSVLAGAGDPDHPGRDPWIKIDAELAIGPRRRVSVPGVWANPGGLHAVLSNDLAFFQAQMGRDGAGISVHHDDPEGHASQLYANIDRMLAGADLQWTDVVHARVFCRDRDQIAAAGRQLKARIAGRPCATTCLIAGFFDPRALLEVEITAALP